MKCPMCKSRNIIDIEKPTERPLRISEDKEIIIYPTSKCLKCGNEFMFKKARNC
jgi:predicted Zn-ribbon and HTH transcriptional regulator